jgi:hypothetical protein
VVLAQSGTQAEGTIVTSDYDKGFSGEPSGPATNMGEYSAGQAARRAPGPNAVASAAASVGSDLVTRPIPTLISLAAQIAVIPLVVGAIATGLAFVLGQLASGTSAEALVSSELDAAFDVGRTAWLVTLVVFTFYVLVILLGTLLGLSLGLLRVPLSLWRWVLGFALLGTGYAYLQPNGATNAVQLVVQVALIGFAAGCVFRLLRGTRRRARARTSTTPP